MRSRRIVPALLLAAWLSPLAARAAAAVDLLDASSVAHPAAVVQLVLHGHSHGGRVPEHEHAAVERPAPGARLSRASSKARAACVPVEAGGRGRTDAPAAALTCPEPPLRSSRARHLVLDVLRI